MSNGYGGSSGSSSSSRAIARSATNAQGQTAPAGFHYMPNGKLMSDADHIATHGYIERNITSFYIDTKDILHEGETRTFQV